MSQPSLSRLLASTLLAAAPLAAQFTSVTSTPVAPGCNQWFTGCCAIASMPASLQLALDSTAQRLDVTVTALEGCCGVAVPLRALALGTAPAAVPLPEFGAACTLHVQPAVLLATAGTTFSMQLPPSVATLGFLAQGLAWQTWSFGPPAERFLFTDAYAVTLQ
jgi:hypothetical protein